MPPTTQKYTSGQTSAISDVASQFDRGGNSSLNAAQQSAIANVQSAFIPAPKIPNTISSESLKPSPAVSVPPKPLDPNYNGALLGGNTTIAGNSGVLSPQTDTNSSDILSWVKNYMPQEASMSAIHDQVYNNSAEGQQYHAQQDVVNQNMQKQLDAQSALASTTAQIQGITAQGQAAALQQEGRQAPMAQIQGAAAEQNRQAAIKALPLQALALAQQAQVAAAQGNTQLSQNILAQAKDHVDTIFQLHAQDAKAQYEYKTNLFNSIKDFITKQDERAYNEQVKAKDQAFTTQQNQLNYAQGLASTAIQNGQPQLAAKISALDPRSPTYAQDVASFAGSIQQNPLDVALKQAQLAQAKASTANTYSEIAARGQTAGQTLNGKPQTSVQAQVQGYADRTNEADHIINNVGNQFTGIGSYVGEHLPNFLKSSDRQQYEQAQQDFINSVLRRESGAAISSTEFDRYSKQYFPQPGDSPQVLAQKATNRQTTINNLYQQANIHRTATPGQIIEDDNGKQYRVGEDGDTLIPV